MSNELCKHGFDNCGFWAKFFYAPDLFEVGERDCDGGVINAGLKQFMVEAKPLGRFSKAELMEKYRALEPGLRKCSGMAKGEA